MLIVLAITISLNICKEKLIRQSVDQEGVREFWILDWELLVVSGDSLVVF